jgi:hypothetical protein
MTVEVRETVEVVSWVLGFGDKARVIEPERRRADVAGELSRGCGAYPPVQTGNPKRS